MGSGGINRDMSSLLARRQERAFERLYRRHVTDVYRYALVVLRDPEDAESITQATFVSAYRAHRRGEMPRKPRNWLMGLAHDACRRRSLPTGLAPGDEWFDYEEAPTPNDVRRALQKLGFDQRAALVMRELEGRTNGEIAELLELEVGEVESIVFRARQALREGLEHSLTCHQAERALSRQIDGRLPRSERKLLKAHLRSCAECTRFAQTQQSHRQALRAYGFVPPPEQRRIFGIRIGIGAVVRTAGVAAIALVAGGVIAGGVDPRQWGDDATRLQPAKAATEEGAPVRRERPAKPPVHLAPG
jgi:RNA polymerase sigma-70 factor (ECF subfamily)